MKGKALRRALKTTDAIRIGIDLPLIVDTTELITPEIAHEMLQHNKRNRPINWKKVEEYADLMSDGKWELHAQGIIIDSNGNILTGQKRLWAVIYSNTNVYMRVSRGNPPKVANLIDRGTPQSARDLATRVTEKKHSPIESSMARAIRALDNKLRPSTDELAETITQFADRFTALLEETKGTKKTKSVLMVLSALSFLATNPEQVRTMTTQTEMLAKRLDHALLPQTADQCWGRGSAFVLAMQLARRIVDEAISHSR
jgi:hypothetical protein